MGCNNSISRYAPYRHDCPCLQWDFTKILTETIFMILKMEKKLNTIKMEIKLCLISSNKIVYSNSNAFLEVYQYVYIWKNNWVKNINCRGGGSRWQRRMWSSLSPTNTSEIHQHMEHFSQKTNWKLTKHLLYSHSCKKDLHTTQ